MEEVVRRDFTPQPSRWSWLELLAIPGITAVVELGEVMNFFVVRQVDIGVVFEQLIQAGGASLLGADAKKMRSWMAFAQP